MILTEKNISFALKNVLMFSKDSALYAHISDKKYI